MPCEKRARTDAPPPHCAQGFLTKGKKPKPPPYLLRVPLDVLVAILSLLCPIALLNVARTSKDFYHFLTSPSASIVWKSARGQVLGLPVPSPPKDVLELRWAVLHFGRSTCNVCHDHTASIDLALLLRICNECRRQQLVTRYYADPSIL
ncbi:hypothetical protein FA95DRAFT_947411 [Auriscalpium vulgare]|uniref:Uncharacterized protein n=1 Tax=Auriscalpium vulgare TaxID=40419 RepID=A0ACB8RZ15_9AGAM|nr:hypothetical protein FA95DRAFT_947411 [Auriscalpium vulgare]